MRPLLSEGIDARPAADGLGPGAGRILVAKPWEYNHFTSKVSTVGWLTGMVCVESGSGEHVP